jgi:2,4-dienoyl-CoA reductase (NADPH2)
MTPAPSSRGQDPGDLHRRVADRLENPRAINSGACDGVSIARSLIANPNLPKFWAAGDDLPPSPCTYCNRCCSMRRKIRWAAMSRCALPITRAMVEQLMTIYNTHPTLQVPTPQQVSP